ncbi:acetyl-CoA carboxylase biotin carboxyl carrier protein [Pusillimonas sp.]|uniref:acetyl-CoA carboxylase biotin carboxyl carrier protein n=1 Tax=Pusillimonas sp. TaxID=3040095 RepID=UPI0037CB49E5
MDIDLAELASLVTLLKEADFTEFRYEKGDTQIVVRRGGEANLLDMPAPALAATASSSASAAEAAPRAPAGNIAPARAATANPPILPQPAPGAKVITAPMLGTFYAASKPGEPAFVQVGDTVQPDSVVCIIEVMKLMNSIHAEMRGTVVAVHAQNGELVEFGQPLFSIQEAEAP